jgi:hypothetical protein
LRAHLATLIFLPHKWARMHHRLHACYAALTAIGSLYDPELLVQARCKSSIMPKPAVSYGCSPRCAQRSRRRPWSVLRRGWKSLLHQSKARHMATKAQIDQLARRIDDLAHRAAPQSGPHIGIIWRMPGESDNAARRRHALQYPDDVIESMLIVGWEPMTAAEWEQKYCVGTSVEARRT